MYDLTTEQAKQIVDSIAPVPQVHIVPRHVYVVVGKPGSGKSTLAAKLAALSETVLIQPEALLDKHLKDEESPLRGELLALLEAGKSIPETKVLEMVQSYLDREETSYRGYTIDGFPCLSNDLQPVPLVLTDGIPKEGSTNSQQEQGATGSNPRTASTTASRALDTPMSAGMNTSLSASPNASRPITTDGTSLAPDGTSAQNTIDGVVAEPAAIERDNSFNGDVDSNSKGTFGFPAVSEPTSNEAMITGSDSPAPLMVLPDVKMIHTLLSKRGPMHVPVLVHLRISDENLIRRRAGQWIDPVTQIGYPAQQVLYSRRRRHEGYTDGSVDIEALIEAGRDPSTISSGGEDGNPGQDDLLNAEGLDKMNGQDEDDLQHEFDENEDPSVLEAALNDPSRFKRKHLKPLSIKNKQTWPILSVAILDRLVKNPFDEPSLVMEELKKFQEQDHAIEEIAAKYFDILRIINLDANLHPDLLHDQVKMRLEMRGFSIFNKPVEVKRIPAPEIGGQGMSDQELIKYYQGWNTDENEPARELGPYGKFCPVTYYNEQKLVEGSLQHVTLYRGIFYCCTDAEKADLFAKNPDKFLLKKMSISEMKVAVLGSPLSGKTVQARLIARKYGLAYISVDEVIAKLESDKPENMTKKAEQLWNKICFKLKKGQPLATDVLMEIITYAFKQAERKGKTSRGWVLDNFPRNAEQAKALIQANMMPKYFIRLQAELGDDFVVARAKALRTKLDGTLISPTELDITSIAQIPYLEKLYSGFKDDSIELGKVIEEAEGQIVQIYPDQGVQTVFNIALAAIDPLIPKAFEISGNALGDSEIEWGSTKDFCPVSLQTTKMLVKGSRNFAAKYLGKVYFFATAEMRNSFLLEPYTYLRNIKIPPPRLVFLGAIGSGKTQYMDEFAKYGIPRVNYNKFALEYANRQDEEKREEILPYLKDGAIMPATILTEILNSLFSEKPYSETGFLLENFPSSRVDLEIALKSGMLPDAFVYCKITSDIAAKRALPSRRAELEVLKQLDLERAKAPKEVKLGDDGSEIVPEAGVDDSKAAENATHKYNMTDEELLEDTVGMIEKEISQILEYIGTIEGTSSVPCIEINTSKTLRPVLAQMKRKLKPYLENRSCMLCGPTVVSNKIVDYSLKTGRKYFSPLGKYCPVNFKKTGVLVPGQFGKRPVLYQDHIYFVQDKFAEKEFLINPLPYLVTRHPEPIVQPTICIIGNPKAGATSIARRLSEDSDLVYLSVPDILQSILDGNEITSLRDRIQDSLSSGSIVPDKTIIEAVVLITSRVTSSGRGWILDGFPKTIDQYHGLEEAKFLPHLVLNLSVDEHEIIWRTEADRRNRLLDDSPQLDAVDVAMSQNLEHLKNVSSLKSAYESKFCNWLDLNGTLSKWAIKDIVKDKLSNGVKRRQEYLDRKLAGLAAPVLGIGLSREHIQRGLGKFGEYCPVRYVDSDELECSSGAFNPVAEYKDQFFFFHTEKEQSLFLADPEHYVNGKDLPPCLPTRRTIEEVKSMFPKQLELRGYCPVTFCQGPKGFDSIIPGSPACVVEYDSKLYSMKNEEALTQFLRTPWKFVNLQLPKKLPPPSAPISVAGLPTVAYLEQNIASALTNALTAVGKLRPKFPYKNVEESACQYVGLYLKAQNPRSKEWIRKSYERRLKRFNETCVSLKELTTKLKKVKTFIPPKERPIGLDEALDGVLKCKNEQHSPRSLPPLAK